MREQAAHLELLADQLRRRVARLTPLVHLATPPSTPELDRRMGFVTIELLNSWASFARAFFISCALRAHTAGGIKIAVAASGLSTPADAIGVAMRRLKNKTKGPFARRNEPSWHPPSNIITLINEISASNMATVAAALSYPTHAFTCLPIARNFYAHRNAETAANCRKLSATLAMPAARHPTDFLLQRDYSKPNNVISEWMADIVTVADLMVQ